MADAQGILQRVFDDGAQALRVLLGGTVSDDAPSSPVEGDFWYESDTGSFFVRVGGSWVEIAAGTGTLPGLSDVTITAVADNEVLAYDTGTSEWINQTAAEAGLAAASHTHTAAATTFTPDGSIAATNVQDAIEEVRDEAGSALAIPKTIIDAAGDLIVGTAADTAARLAMGTALQVLRVNAGATALEWATASGGSPGGSDTYVQYNDGGAFGGEAAFAYNETTNRLTVTGGYRMDPGSGNSIGDTDGNGYLYFDGNAAHLYGYTSINLRDSSGEFASFTRARIALGVNPLTPSDWFGGNPDYGIKLGPEVNAYAGSGFGSVFTPDVNATANNDYLVGTGFQTTFQLGAYTGTTLINAGFVNTKAAEIGVWVKGFTSQSVDLFRAVDSSNATLMAIAKNGAIKPASLADSAAENSTIYYSTDASKLVFKDSGGSVNALY